MPPPTVQGHWGFICRAMPPPRPGHTPSLRPAPSPSPAISKYTEKLLLTWFIREKSRSVTVPLLATSAAPQHKAVACPAFSHTHPSDSCKPHVGASTSGEPTLRNHFKDDAESPRISSAQTSRWYLKILYLWTYLSQPQNHMDWKLAVQRTADCPGTLPTSHQSSIIFWEAMPTSEDLSKTACYSERRESTGRDARFYSCRTCRMPGP